MFPAAQQQLALAWSRMNYPFQDTGGLIDPRVGRGFYDTFRAGFRVPGFPPITFFTPDRFPVFITPGHEPDAQNEQSQLPATGSEPGGGGPENSQGQVGRREDRALCFRRRAASSSAHDRLN